MSIENLLRLPILSALLLQLILSPPTSSFSLSPTRRLWTPLRASGDTYDDSDLSSGSKEDNGGANPFESIVRRVTNNEEYKFGDITRSLVDTTTHGVEDVVRTVTHDENYNFGDITKKAIGSTTHGFEGTP